MQREEPRHQQHDDAEHQQHHDPDVDDLAPRVFDAEEIVDEGCDNGEDDGKFNDGSLLLKLPDQEHACP